MSYIVEGRTKLKSQEAISAAGGDTIIVTSKPVATFAAAMAVAREWAMAVEAPGWQFKIIDQTKAGNERRPAT